MNGRINSYNDEKGYGFIIGADEEKYFFHISDYKDTDNPNTSDLVEFTPIETDRGKTAKTITLIKSIGSKMILIDKFRIRVGEIKAYSVKEVIDPYASIKYEKEMKKWNEIHAEEIRANNKVTAKYGGYVPFQHDDEYIRFDDKPSPMGEIITVLEVVLYNNKAFYIVDDIDKWLKKLDEIFNIQ